MHTYFLESTLTGSNGWPTIVIPSVPDPTLAPDGCHVLHATMTEPYAPWAALPRGGPEYERLKAERGAVLMGLVRQVRPAPRIARKFGARAAVDCRVGRLARRSCAMR